MARTARKTAQSGIYHISFRPNENRTVFCSEQDITQLLVFLSDETKRDAFEVFAYCILPDRAHMVVREGLSGVSTNLMRVIRLYANYCNHTQSQTGKLIRGRFYSAPLESPAVILDATRFVHRLPLSFGFPLTYEYSSFRHFFKRSELLQNEAVLSIFPAAIDYRLYCDNACTHRFKM